MSSHNSNNIANIDNSLHAIPTQSVVIEAVDIEPLLTCGSLRDVCEAVEKLTRSIDRLCLELKHTHPVDDTTNDQTLQTERRVQRASATKMQSKNELGYKAGDMVRINSDGTTAQVRKATRCYVWCQVTGNILWVKKQNKSVTRI